MFADKNTNNIEASGISPYMDYFDLDDNECDVRWFDFNKLTDDEQKELQAVYGRYEEYEEEWDELETKEAELEKKAGWICEEDCDGPDGMWYDMSKLTEEEQKELDRIYERYEEIEAAIYGEDFEATDDEIINNYSRYEKELLELEEKASVLEEKAEDYGALTEDEIRELINIYEQFDVIGEKILGDDDNLTDEELESRFSKYESEWNELEQKAETLEKKAWGK